MKSLEVEQGESAGTPGRRVLTAAGIYNLLWGLFVILRPEAFFRWASFEPLPNYPQLWQCMGMVIGVYGIGYLIAASDTVRHWPIVLVGLLGKVLGPLGFVWTAGHGQLPWRFGVLIVTNDLIWWVPFTLVLWNAWKHHREAGSCQRLPKPLLPTGQTSAA